MLVCLSLSKGEMLTQGSGPESTYPFYRTDHEMFDVQNCDEMFIYFILYSSKSSQQPSGAA